MMRSPHFYTVTVRDEKGDLRVDQKAFESVSERLAFLKWPLLRGVVQLVESMKIGFAALDFSNRIFVGEEDKEEGFWSKFFSGVTMLFSFGFALFLLKFVPLWVARWAASVLPVVESHDWLFNSVDGLVKLVVFMGYILLISLLKDIRRTFAYHGAEHKSIWAYEKGLKLTVANARKQTRFHPRCGTSFLFLVILMSIVVYTVMPAGESFASQLAVRLAVIPLIAGLGYEVLKLSGKYSDFFLLKMLAWPGLLFQRLSTREPDDEQLEVALHSLKESLKVESVKVP